MVSRGLYSHHAVVVRTRGGDQVVHFSEPPEGGRPLVRLGALAEFLGGAAPDQIRVIPHRDANGVETIVRRARWCVSVQPPYSLTLRNCEHLATWSIRLLERNGLTFTLDNRRLFVFQQAGMPIRTVPATAEEIAAEAWKFTTRNEGASVRVRGGL